MDIPGFLKGIALVCALVGGMFWKLALRHNRNPIVFTIVGITSYYIGAFIGGVIVTSVIIASGNVAFSNDGLITWVGIPFGALTCWLTYRFLKKTWSKPKQFPNTGGPLDSNL